GLDPRWLLPIAVIAAGVALVFEGGAIAARFWRLVREVEHTPATNLEMGSGMSAEIGGGVAGIVLGVLALAGVATVTLCAVAALVFGATLLMSCSTTARFNHLLFENVGWHDMARKAAGEAVSAASGLQALVGIAAIVLGILALIGTYPVLLTLVAMLCVGG